MRYIDNRVPTAELIDGTITEPKLQTAVSNNRNAKRTAKYRYDFAVLGGAVSIIPLTGDVLPANAVVTDGRLIVITPLVGGVGATAGIDLVAVSDIILAAAVAGAPWNAVGDNPTIPINTAATDVACAAGGTPSINIAVNPLTAGVFDLLIDYYVTD